MSASDVETLLNTPKIFILLPVVNYTYLIGTTDADSALILCFIAAISSAFIYNTLDGIPVDQAADVRLGLTLVFGISGVVWLYLLYRSAKTLLNSFHLTSIVHEVLFFTTVVFASIVLTHLLLLVTVEEYQNRV